MCANSSMCWSGRRFWPERARRLPPTRSTSARRNEGGPRMRIETLMSDQLARYLDLASSEAKLTAENMANVDTPGYRAVGMDFEGEMRQAMTETAAGGQARPVQ